MPTKITLFLAATIAASASGCTTFQGATSPPYSVVSGEWGFSEVDECSTNPRTFSFHKSGRILRATHQEVSEAGDGDLRKVFDYDILGSSPQELHVSLHGETRLDGAGNPVTWHLVIFDKDTLRWRQNDWEAGEFTSELVRCKV
ncbi:hypothetical protein QFW80_00050 [Luteimonas sp. M1R5S18]|uniref:Lipoprotein n=1 Tax=Luteimonas rhizosphaericola TaxID=3042024 RepID=A0ABT6JEN1_9GAMM|nr:hypothetical protein [Luteimonas rhizosphaericola]MDH5828915.1 hypothetical protein [Luteimonas rhizosphaericola]